LASIFWVEGQSLVKQGELGKGFIRKREKREIGLFIDGTGLDRATRRLNRRVDMAALVRGVTSGLAPTIARYYTLIPYEDDSRQRAFLDAVSRAGLTVIVKRLPPKGITRQVTVDLEMASDIVAYSLGCVTFSKEVEYRPIEEVRVAVGHAPMDGRRGVTTPAPHSGVSLTAENTDSQGSPVPPERRSIVVVCPSRELAYPLSLAGHLGVDTTSADFGQFNTGDVLKSAAKWIDLSDSETIWRE